MNSKCIPFIFSFVLFTHLVCGQYHYETKLFNCIDKKLELDGYDLKDGLKSFESQLYKLGYLSDSIDLKKLFRSQVTCDIPLIIKKHVESIDVRKNNFLNHQTNCIELVGTDSNSTFEKIRYNFEKIKNISSITNSYLDSVYSVLKEEDFDHPFYRMLILVTLHSWSIEGNPTDYLESGCL